MVRSFQAFFLTCVLVLAELLIAGFGIGGCEANPDVFGSESAATEIASDDLKSSVPCAVSAVRYPTSAADMKKVYNGRSFYADGNHLGHDVKLPEGVEIRPIGCGVLRVYRAANGYGRLVVVIEHKLGYPMSVVNGQGAQTSVVSFLTIYGHLRMTENRDGTGWALPWKTGDTVGPSDVIGFVDDDDHNGDGAEHLHFGVRLQTATDAQATDKAWFRGYDTTPSQRKWYADPALFMQTLQSGEPATTTWHPAGTFIQRTSDGSIWLLDAVGKRYAVSTHDAEFERLWKRTVPVGEAEFNCYADGGTFVSERSHAGIVKYPDNPAVFEFDTNAELYQPHTARRAFISYEAFRSWGWEDADLNLFKGFWPSEKEFFDATYDAGFRKMRDGTLVKGKTESEVSVVSGGKRLPLASWTVFLALGYREKDIVIIPTDTLDVVAGTRGDVITEDKLATCAYSSDGQSPPPGGNDEGEGNPGPGNQGAGGMGQGSGVGGSQATTTTSTTTSTQTQTTTTTSTKTDMNSVHFVYSGPPMSGKNELQAWWQPPQGPAHPWGVVTECQDAIGGDGELDCMLPLPHGTTHFTFTIHLPNGGWWGDMSCAPKGGCGDTIGMVTVTSAGQHLPIHLEANGPDPQYVNGVVNLIP